MKTVVLDLTGCKNTRDMHERILITFDFPPWYGKNWDALFDFLRTETDAEKVIIKGESTLPEDMNPDIKKLHNIFDITIEDSHRHNYVFSYQVID